MQRWEENRWLFMALAVVILLFSAVFMMFCGGEPLLAAEGKGREGSRLEVVGNNGEGGREKVEKEREERGKGFRLEIAEAVRVELVRVVDGDTIRVLMPSGEDGGRQEEAIRLLGIDTPERGQPGFAEASSFVVQFLESKSLLQRALEREQRRQVLALPNRGRSRADPDSKNFLILVGDPDFKRDKYGRILAYVHDERGDDLGAALLLSGHAKVYEWISCGRTAFYQLILKNRRVK